MHAVILAGGLGTRLRGVVDDRPKPMAEIGGRPFLEYLLANLRRQGFSEAVLCTGYLAEAVEHHFGDGRRFGLSLRHSREPQPLGTGGALKHAQPLLAGERWLVLNGDTFFDLPYAELADAHRAAGALATMALARVPDASRFGVVDLGPGGRIEAFRDACAGPALANGGVYVVERALLDRIPAGAPASLERDVFGRLAGGRLHGVEFAGELIDIGTPDAYLRLREAGAGALGG
jgi:NDP-sugar pyrophosphorylase family protein